MEKFIVIAICMVLAITIGTSFLTGDTNSLKSSLGTVMTDTADSITDL